MTEYLHTCYYTLANTTGSTALELYQWGPARLQLVQQHWGNKLVVLEDQESLLPAGITSSSNSWGYRW
jgi:hypothetical protein